MLLPTPNGLPCQSWACGLPSKAQKSWPLEARSAFFLSQRALHREGPPDVPEHSLPMLPSCLTHSAPFWLFWVQNEWTLIGKISSVHCPDP